LSTQVGHTIFLRDFQENKVGTAKNSSFGESKWVDLVKKGPKIILPPSQIT
jgi:hypothetical protein